LGIAVLLAFSAVWSATTHAAESAPASTSEKPFTVVILPDTQYYCDLTCGGTPAMYMSQVKWIRERLEQDNIKFVIHLGDIVNIDNQEQWKIADRAHRVLDGVVPYSVLPGNHDMRDIQTRATLLYNEYFGPKRFQDNSWYGGHRGEKNDNNYCFFQGGGHKFMVLSLQWDPTDAMIKWAGDVVRAHPNYHVIVATHEYMGQDKRSDMGERMWNRFVRRHPNIFLVVSGHIIGWGHQTSTGDHGNPIHEVLTDYQWEPDGLKYPPLGGDGWLNTMRFVPTEKKIDFRSYSPWLKKSRTTPRHQYTLPYEPEAFGSDGGSPENTTPLNRIFYLPFEGSSDAAEAGGNKKATVRGDVEFTPGRNGQAAVFRDNNHLRFHAYKNLDPNEGTLALWVKPLSDADDGKPHAVLQTTGGVLICKGISKSVPNLFYFFRPGMMLTAYGKTEGIWIRGKWTHLLITWSQKRGKFTAYVDGKRCLDYAGTSSSAGYSKQPSNKGKQIVVGCRRESNSSANAVIDELQIFDRMVSAEEAWGLAGGTGPVPEDNVNPLDPAPLFSLPHDLITPHVPFAKPIAGKPVKCLFIVPRILARDVVELWQRMEIDDEAFTFDLTHRHRDKLLQTSTRVRRFHQNVARKDRLDEIMKKLSVNPEVIVLVDADIKNTAPQIRTRIDQLVRDGTGLVMTSRGIQQGPWLKDKDPQGWEEICRGIPWSGLPEPFPDAPVRDSELSEKVIQTYRHGKGRVVAIRFRPEPIPLPGYLLPEAGLTPCLYDAPYKRQWNLRYGKYLSLAGKALRWAGGKSPQWQLQFPDDGMRWERAALPKSNAFKVGIKAGVTGKARLLTTIRDPLGKVEWDSTYPVNVEQSENPNAISLDMPVLKTGLHYLELRLLAHEKTEDWGDVAFFVTGPEEIENVSLTTDSVEHGDKAEGKVRLCGSCPRPLSLTVQAIDTNDRIYEREVYDVQPGTQDIAFELRLDSPSTLGGYIEVVLRDGDRIVAQKDAAVFVPKRNLEALTAHEFPSIGWCGISPLTGSAMIMAEPVRKAGFNIQLRVPKNVAFRNLAMWDLTPLSYAANIQIHGGEKGWVRTSNKAIKDGSFENPEIKQYMWDIFSKRLLDCRKYGPFFYSLGDENRHYGEFGFSPWGQRAFRRHLTHKYGTIDQLNREWQSDYRSFDDVSRLTAGEAKEQRHVPAMIDHRAAQEMVYRDMYVYLRDEIKKYDPLAKVGAEGSQTKDVEAMLNAMDVWAPYPSRKIGTLMSAVATPAHITGHWYGSYCEGDKIPKAALTRYWDQALRGFGNTSFYFHTGLGAGGDGILMTDGSYKPFFKTQMRDLLLIGNGVGQLLRTSAVKPSGVYLHWSQASKLGLEAADEFGIPTEAEGGIIKTLGKLGIEWGYITGRQINRNPDIVKRAKIIILPASQCISGKEAQALEQFVKDGGILLGLGPVGIRNEFGRELRSSQLNSVFGVNMRGPAAIAGLPALDDTFTLNGQSISLTGSKGAVNKSVSVTDGKVLLEKEGVPLVVEHKTGKGKALLLNVNTGLCDRESIEQILNSVLTAADISPEITFSPAHGPGDRYGVLQKGDLTLVGVVMDHRPGKWNEGKIHLKEKVHVYDVKKGIYLGELDEIPVKGMEDTQSAALFALQKAKIQGVSIDAPAQVQRDQMVSIGCSVRAPATMSCAGRVVRIELQGPDGITRRHYQRMAYLDKHGAGNVTLQFALNDPVGAWNVIATDIASGVTGMEASTVE